MAGAILGQMTQLHTLLASFRNSRSTLDSPTGILLAPLIGDTVVYLFSSKLSLSLHV